VEGKLIRRSFKTTVVAAAKIRLARLNHWAQFRGKSGRAIAVGEKQKKTTCGKCAHHV
jgi:hypothetical protein